MVPLQTAVINLWHPISQGVSAAVVLVKDGTPLRMNFLVDRAVRPVLPRALVRSQSCHTQLTFRYSLFLLQCLLRSMQFVVGKLCVCVCVCVSADRTELCETHITGPAGILTGHTCTDVLTLLLLHLPTR